MLLEIHCHTAEHSSCSHAAALDLAKQIYRNNLQGVVITDHHFLWPDEELKRLRKSAGLPEYFVVLSGQETTTSDAGDVLVYGAALTIPPRMSLASIRAAHPDAAIILAHSTPTILFPTT
jgi:predicted metal-dependent phosphoesterase TrpH